MRIAGVELKDSWKIDYALTQIKGVGWSLSKKILTGAKIKPQSLVSNLDNDDLVKISNQMENHLTEGELIRKIRSDVQRLQKTGSYRGVRHQKGLPARGQRTRSNARTKRGARKTVGSYKKEVLAKMKPGEKEKENGEK